MGDEKKRHQPERMAKISLTGPLVNYKPFFVPEAFSVAPVDVKSRSSEENLADALAVERHSSQRLALLNKYGPHVYAIVKAWQGGSSGKIRGFFMNGSYDPDEDNLDLFDLYHFWYIMNFSESLPRVQSNLVLYRGQSWDSYSGLRMEKLADVKSGGDDNILSNWSSAPATALEFTKPWAESCCLIRIQIPIGTKLLVIPEMGEFEHLIAGGKIVPVAPPQQMSLEAFPLQTKRKSVMLYTCRYEPGKQWLPWPQAYAHVLEDIKTIPKTVMQEQSRARFTAIKNKLTTDLERATLVANHASKALKTNIK
jgi:hypothetical protein